MMRMWVDGCDDDGGGYVFWEIGLVLIFFFLGWFGICIVFLGREREREWERWDEMIDSLKCRWCLLELELVNILWNLFFD